MFLWQFEMTGNQVAGQQSTMAASEWTFVPSAHRGGVDDQHRDACRRVSFCQSLHPVAGPAVGVSAESVLPAPAIEAEYVLGELASECPAHLALSNVVGIGESNDAVRVDGDAHRGDALVSASGFDFSGLMIGLCHFGPPCAISIVIQELFFYSITLFNKLKNVSLSLSSAYT